MNSSPATSDVPLNFLRLRKIMRKFAAPTDISVVVEIGARDCKESLLFEREFPQAHIHSFECNANTLPECRERVRGRKRITLVEKAVSDAEGPLTFFPINQQKTGTSWKNGNPGASSLLRASGEYAVETYIQDTTTVQSTTLKSYMDEQNIGHVDLLWMDIQGAELKALQGAGGRMRDIAIIHTEVEFLPIYKDQPLFADIKKFLASRGFIFVGFSAYSSYSGDAVFVRADRLKNRIIARLHHYGEYPLRRLRQQLSKLRALLRMPKRRIYSYTYYPSRPGIWPKLVTYYHLLRIRLLRRWRPILNAEVRACAEASKELVIQIMYGGLGDHLLYSSLPRLLWEQKGIRTFISNKSLYTNEGVRDFVWSKNPYISFTDKKGWFNTQGKPQPFATYDAYLQNLFGLSDVSASSDEARPEIFYTPSRVQEAAGKTAIDVSYGQSGLRNGYDEERFIDALEKYLRGLGPLTLVLYKKRPLNSLQNMIVEKFEPDIIYADSIERVCDILSSAERAYTLYSGTASLAAGLGVPATVLCARKTNPYFQYPSNTYISL